MKYTLSKDNLHIDDSYLIKNTKEMKEFINKLKVENPDDEFVINKRCVYSLVNEWCAHNLLYICNFKVDHTKDVDLNIEETTLRKIGYFFLRYIYSVVKIFI